MHTLHGVKEFCREVSESNVTQFLIKVLVGYPKWCWGSIIWRNCFVFAFSFPGKDYAGVFLKPSIKFLCTYVLYNVCFYTRYKNWLCIKWVVLRHSDAFTSSCMHSLMMCTLNLGDVLEILHDESNIISLPSPPLLFTILEICHVFLDFLTTRHKSRAAYNKNCALEFGPIAFMSNGK